MNNQVFKMLLPFSHEVTKTLRITKDTILILLNFVCHRALVTSW